MSCQLSIEHNMNVLYQVKHGLYMPWTPTNAWSLQENIARFAANQGHTLL